MYKVTIKNLSDSSETIIYQNGSYETYIEKPKLSFEWGQPGSFSFTMLPGHISYDDIHPIITFVYVYWDDEELFFGRVLTIDKELFGKKNIYCEGALNFLRDGQLLHSLDEDKTVINFMTWCLNELQGSSPNPATIEPRKQFLVGEVDSSLVSQTAHFKVEEYAEAKSTLDKLLVNRFGGCLVIRKETRSGVINPSGHTLNYLKTVGTTISDRIKICENVRDRTDHDSGESIFTVLRPIGANLGGDNDIPCVLSDNGGVIEITDMVNKYGRIYKTENFSDQDTEAGLRAAAEAYIERLGMDDDDHLPKTCDIKYVDFHYLNPQITKIGFGDVFTDIEGYEGQSMVVGHLELDLENSANDSMSLYNQAYLDAREYSALLESSTGAGTAKSTASGRSGGGGGSAIAKTLASATKAADTKTEEVKEHFEHKTTETNKELHDCYGIIGVKLDPGTHLPVKDANDDYVWGVEGTDPVAEIWGHFHRTAWNTVVNNMIQDGQGNILSIGQVSTSADGKVFIDAINDQHTGTAKISADRILIGSTSGSFLSIDENGALNLTANDAVAAINASTAQINANKIALNSAGTITLASKLSIDAITNRLNVSGDLSVSDDIYVHGDTYIDGVIEMFDTFMSDSESFQAVTARFGASGSGVSQRILGHGSLLVGLDATENADGTITISFADNSYGGHDSANFRIAATQFYIDGVAARTANSISNITLPSTHTGTDNCSVTVTSSDNHTESLTVSVDASNVYNAGISDGTATSTDSIALASTDVGIITKSITIHSITNDTSVNLDINTNDVYNAGKKDGQYEVSNSISFKVQDETTGQMRDVTNWEHVGFGNWAWIEVQISWTDASGSHSSSVFVDYPST